MCLYELEPENVSYKNRIFSSAAEGPERIPFNLLIPHFSHVAPDKA